MNKQVVDQPRAESQTRQADNAQATKEALAAKKAGKGMSKDGRDFDAQLSAAAMLAPQAQQQQLQTLAQAMAAAQEQLKSAQAPSVVTAEGAPEAQQAKPGLNLKAVSMNTESAIAGLKQPGIGSWVFEGQGSPAESALNPAQISRQPAADALTSKEGAASRPLVTRGEADAALASKLEMLGLGSPQLAQPSALHEGLMDASAGTTIPQGMQPAQQAPMHAGRIDAAAAQDAGIEAQLAQLGGSMGGAIQENRPLAAGAKGRLGVNAQAGLSGTDFLSTLGAAKAGMQVSRFEQGSQFQGEQGGGEGKGAGFGGKSSLRMIQGGAKNGKAGFESELTASQALGNLAVAAPGTHVSATALGGTGLAAEVTGHVVQGANAENRLSSEALAGIGGGIRNFANQGTGGEMRIRLKPENLGELHVRVVTDGRNVGLQIQASDEKSKKILEESLTHLKESMAAQNLTLGTVDLTVAHSQGASFGEGNPQGQSQNQGMLNDMLGGGGNLNQGREGQGGREGAWSGDNTGSVRTARPGVLGASAQSFAQPRSLAAAASGRLDVQA